jgi:hypothetical protein
MVEPRAEHDYLKAHANSAYIRLNDLIIGTVVVVLSLEDYATAFKDSEKPITISIPSGKGKNTRISRSPAEFIELLAEQSTSREYEKTLIFSIAEAEDHIASCIRVVLLAYPDRLTRGPRGGTSSDRTVRLEEIIGATSKESLINSIVEDRIGSVMRRRPSEYLEFLAQIIEGHLSNHTVGQFCELCATRDLIVHAQGKINEEYLAKAGAQARGKLGKVIVVDDRYFNASMSNIKDLYGEIHSIMRRKYSKD